MAEKKKRNCGQKTREKTEELEKVKGESQNKNSETTSENLMDDKSRKWEDSAMNFFMLRLDRFTLFVYASSVIFDASLDLPRIGKDFLSLLSKQTKICACSVFGS